MIKSLITIPLISLLEIGTLAIASQAAILNGGFEDIPNFVGWNTAGDASIQTSFYGSGPTQPTKDALLTTALNTNPLNKSGTNPVSVGLNNGLEDFLGIPIGSLDPDPDNFVYAYQGSAIKQDFTAQVGDKLTLDWNFLTNDTRDYSFIVLSEVSSLSNVTYSSLPKLNNSTGVNSTSAPTPFNLETGFKQFSYTFTTGGNYRLGIGVVDVGDSDIPSGVLIDNIVLTPQNISTPESSSIIGLFIFTMICFINTIKAQG